MAKAKAKPARKKRLTREERAAAEAERLAKLLADMPAEGCGALAPPGFIAMQSLKPAAQVWRDHAPRLHKLGLLGDLDRYMFALMCVYAAEFVIAHEEILLKGYAVETPMTNGGHMLRENPAVARRDVAAKMLLELSRRYGFTPLDRYSLMKVQKDSPYNPLFNDGDAQPQLPVVAPPKAEEGDEIPLGWRGLVNDPPAKPKPN
jgi:P27 family predicted phage terminase small subunit